MQGIKIFSACAIGSFIGSLVALQFTPTFWWVGLIAGFIVGYSSYEYREVGRAIVKVWTVTIGWRPDVEAMKLKMKIYGLASLCGTLSIIVIFTPFIFFVDSRIVVQGMFAAILIIAPSIGFSFFIDSDGTNEQRLRTYRGMHTWLRISNPFLFYFYYAPKGILWFIRQVPHAIGRTIIAFLIAFRAAKVFAKQVFILIHSDMRLLCGVDAAVGAGIGYFAGNALLGALGGGLFGLLEYYLITILLLRLKPDRQQ